MKIRTEYQLIKTIDDSIIKYDYKSKIDSTRNFSAHFRKDHTELILHYSKFKKKNIDQYKNLKISNDGFDIYDLPNTESTDEIGPILFNPKYGILAIGNPLGPAHAFINTDPKQDQVEMIFAELY